MPSRPHGPAAVSADGRHRRLPSPVTLVVAGLALVLASTGGATAAALVTGKQIKNGSVTGRDLKNGSVTTKDVKNGTLVLKDFKPSERKRLVGPAGPQGPQGIPGVQGAQGFAGATGAAGANGANGTNGADGTDGASGIVSASYANGSVAVPGPSLAFTGPTIPVTIGAGERVHISGSAAYGAGLLAAGGLSIYPCYRPIGQSDEPDVLGTGLQGLTVSSFMRQTYSASAVTPVGLAPGSYDVGLCAQAGPNWIGNDWAYLSVLVFRT